MGWLKQRSASKGRLHSRPSSLIKLGASGLQRLELDDERDGLLYVPEKYQPDHPLPLILMLHGAGGDAEGALGLIEGTANSSKAIILAVDSRQRTWDIIVDYYGADIAFIDRALALTFRRYAIDLQRIGIAGFSDGASYALSVGVINGDLFTHIVGFSPGFMAPTQQVGTPQVFISHGKRDQVLPIDRCSRRIVPCLQQAGYQVLYREFDGPHTVPEAITHEALNWFTASALDE